MKKEYSAVSPSMARMETYGFSWMDFVTAIPSPPVCCDDLQAGWQNQCVPAVLSVLYRKQRGLFREPVRCEQEGAFL